MLDINMQSTLQVRRLSVKQVTSPLSLDGLGNVLPGGLYDAAMGPLDQSSRCRLHRSQLRTPLTICVGWRHTGLRHSCLFCERLLSLHVPACAQADELPRVTACKIPQHSALIVLVPCKI